MQKEWEVVIYYPNSYCDYRFNKFDEIGSCICINEKNKSRICEYESCPIKKKE